MTTFSMMLHYVYFSRSCAMSTFYTLLCYDFLYHDALLCLLFQRCCAMSIPFPWCSTITPFSTLLRYDYFLNAAALCLPFLWCSTMTTFPRCCPMTPFPTLLRYVYFLHATVLWLPFQWCSKMSTLSTLLCFVYVFHADAVRLFLPMLLDYVYFIHAALLFLFFHDAALCLPFLWCSTLTNFSTLLRYDYFPRSPTMSTFSMMLHYVFFLRCCALSTVSILLLRYVYFFHAAALCLLFPRCSTKTTFMRWSRYFRREGRYRSIRQKKLWQRFLFL